MPQPTIAELIDTYPPPPAMTKTTAQGAVIANQDYVNWSRGLADLNAAQAAQTIAAYYTRADG